MDPEVAHVLKEIDEPKRKVLMQALVTRQYSGPLPDGDTIKVYAEVIPEGGDRLMTTVEE